MDKKMKENNILDKRQKLIEDSVVLLQHVTYEHLHGVYEFLKVLTWAK